MKEFIGKIVSVLKNRSKAIFKTRFRRRILKRQDVYWKKSTDSNKIHEKLYASDSMSKWKDMDNWQRRLENKLNAKEFAAKMGCKVARLYWNGKFEDFKLLDFDKLPVTYVLKPISDYSSRNVYVMSNNLNLLTGRQYIDVNELKSEIFELYSSRPDLEMMIEEFIPQEAGNFEVANDYKFYMFNGNLAFIKLDEREGKAYEKVTFYDSNWNLFTKKILTFANVETPSKPPQHLEEMIRDAKKLSLAYENFVRIDFYDSPDGPVFGEFTPTPRGGVSFTPYGSKLLISYWDRYCKDMI
ncbi:ATP-grasp fold amidoligase family protein [uncultured Christiangramia sp.]|uniref:ATP-grasp fold amidoligase family protein n=1 Tax=uncultured Christiangramia sp. TaxID=503836 RepID=UPI00262F0C15|nr:ATP-grasp fold amidoligase family protein [uncultured Christiangramia sp.]